MAAKRKYTKKAKVVEPVAEMYKVTINDGDYGSRSIYVDPIYFTKATSRQEALTKVLPVFFAEHKNEDIENLRIERDTESSFVE